MTTANEAELILYIRRLKGLRATKCSPAIVEHQEAELDRLIERIEAPKLRLVPCELTGDPS